MESIPIFPTDCTEGSRAPGTALVAQGGVAEHPPFWDTQLAPGATPLPAWRLLARGWAGVSGGCSPSPSPEKLGEEAEALAETEGGRGGVWRREPVGSTPHHLYKLVLRAP